MDEYTVMRRNMVKHQIRERGIIDERVMRAMGKVPRHEFVPEKYRKYAYSDEPLPIGEGQTISQPYMVALVCECLELAGGEKVLEVGCGSGYQAAVLAELAGKVYSLENRKKLAERAMKKLYELGYKNVDVIHSDGSEGYEKEAPYDGIVFSAACEEIPPSALRQLKEGGIIVVPVGGTFLQNLLKIRKDRGKILKESVTPCVFVPLVSDVFQ